MRPGLGSAAFVTRENTFLVLLLQLSSRLSRGYDSGEIYQSSLISSTPLAEILSFLVSTIYLFVLLVLQRLTNPLDISCSVSIELLRSCYLDFEDLRQTHLGPLSLSSGPDICISGKFSLFVHVSTFFQFPIILFSAASTLPASSRSTTSQCADRPF